jgi:FkbM family methyltransferase
MTGARVRLLGTAAAASRRVGARGAARRLVSVVDRCYAAGGRAPLSVEIAGVRVRGYLRHRSFLAEAMRPGETYADLFVRSLRPGMTVVDGGAHLGLYTALAAHGVGPDGLVVAFEPDRYNLAALRLNAGTSANVRIVPKALADAPGTAVFYETPSTIGSSLLERPESRGRVVETTSVDAELAGREIAQLLVKLNVEGAEPRALAGMRETLSRVGPVTIFVEVNPSLVESAGTDVGALVDGLAGDGFEVGYIELATQAVLPLPRPLPKGHLLATRAG